MADPGARLLLPLAAEGAALERQVDAACRHWNRRLKPCTFLAATAPWLENISMLENLWLPLAWRRPLRLGELVRRARQHLPALGWSEQDLQRLLPSRPGDLPPAVLARALLLRAALAEPDWLLIEADWFSRPLLPPERNLALLEALLGEARWVLLWPAGRAPLPSGVSWHTISLELPA